MGSSGTKLTLMLTPKLADAKEVKRRPPIILAPVPYRTLLFRPLRRDRGRDCGKAALVVAYYNSNCRTYQSTGATLG